MSVSVGLVGLGGYGRFLAAAMAGVPEVQLVAVATSRDRGPAGARVYRSLDEMLRDAEVEAVAVSTPPFLHGKMGLACLEAGKHLWMEKPLACTLEEAQALVDAARRHGRVLTVGHVLRYSPLSRWVREVVRRRPWGPLLYLTVLNRAAAPPADHWFWDVGKSGGIFVEHGVHFFDLCLWWCGPESLSSVQALRREEDGRETRVAVQLGFASGLTVHMVHAFEARSAATEETVVHLGFPEGRVTLSGWFPTALEATGPLTLLPPLPGDPSLRAEGATEGPVGTLRVRVDGGKEAAYQEGVRAAWREFAARVRGRHQEAVGAGAEEGMASLALALRAREQASRVG